MSARILGYVVTKNGCASGLIFDKFKPAAGILSADVKGFTLFDTADKAERAIARTQKYTRTIEPEFGFVEDKWSALPVCGDKKPKKKRDETNETKAKASKRQKGGDEQALCEEFAPPQETNHTLRAMP